MKQEFVRGMQNVFSKTTWFVVVVGLGMLLAGCGIGAANETVPTATAAVDNGQEVASTLPNGDGGTLPPPVIVEASHTPVPATATLAATATPEVTPTPVETEVPPTDTPAPLPPTSPPVVAQPTNPPPPPTETAEPAPPPAPAIGANGLVASYFAVQDRSEFSPGGSVWFEFTIDNQTGGEVSYNALGVMPKKDGVDRFEWYQQTYGGKNSTMKADGLTWEDRIKLPEAGDYTLRLVMCFDGFDNCLQGGGAWRTMSNEIGVTIN